MSTSVRNIISRPEKYEAISEGKVFRQGHKYDILSEGVAYMLIRCDRLYAYMLLSAVADGDVEIEFLAAPTVADTGDPEPSGNFNFNAGRISLTTWFTAPDITAEGIHLASTSILGGSGSAPGTATKSTSTMTDFDVVLIPNVDFLLKFSNNAGRDIQLMFESVYKERKYDKSNLLQLLVPCSTLYPSSTLYPNIYVC